ncbi:MAG: presenilin family intramembrane aspartyl protease [Nanoarchaeota archaeon]|nr:presenilin family intramembrane aspartyl protease [Nanoarchaeota archaeon]
MKHTLKVTIFLVIFFFLAQVVGLLVVNYYIDHKKTVETKVIAWQPLPYNLERPELKNQSTSFIYITVAILIGTILVLLLIRFNKPFIWKLWFFVTVWLTLSIAFATLLNNIVAAIMALIISILKLYKPNIIIQNFSEIFIYGGLAAIFVPIINLFAAFMLLIIISVYDFIAVFKTKHMIKIAKFQSKSKVFAGLLIPYENGKIPISGKKTSPPESKEKKSRVAVLGGGDIGFTLIFAGVVMKGLMLQETMLTGFLKALIIPSFVSLVLLILLLKAEKGKFYPAMPFLSLGCFMGYLVVAAI